MKKLMLALALVGVMFHVYADSYEQLSNEVAYIDQLLEKYDEFDQTVKSQEFITIMAHAQFFTDWDEDRVEVTTNVQRQIRKRGRFTNQVVTVVTNITKCPVTDTVRPIKEAKYKHLHNPWNHMHMEGVGICASCLDMATSRFYSLDYIPAKARWCHPYVLEYLLGCEPLPQEVIKDSYFTKEEVAEQGLVCSALTNNVFMEPKLVDNKIVYEKTVITDSRILHFRANKDIRPLFFIASTGDTYRVYSAWNTSVERIEPYKVIHNPEWKMCDYKEGDLVTEYKIGIVLCPICGPEYRRCRRVIK